MNHYTKIVFGVDENFNNDQHHKLLFNVVYKNRMNIHIQFDTNDEIHFKSPFYHYMFFNKYFEKSISLKIPRNATKIIIASKSNLKRFSVYAPNTSIVSIEHFESNTLTNLSQAFDGFTNLKEFKHFNVTSKVTDASHMCSGWKNFNGIIPEGFCSIFEYLENASYMFSNWESFNQPLPENFRVNTRHLIDATNMFSNWKSFNKPLPRNFFANNINLKYTNKMFYNWFSHSQKISQYLIDVFNKLKSVSYLFCYAWYKNDSVKNDFYLKTNILVKDYKKKEAISFLTKYNEIITNNILMSKLKEDIKIYCISFNNEEFNFIIYKGIFLFIGDFIEKNIDQIKFNNNILGLLLKMKIWRRYCALIV